MDSEGFFSLISRLLHERIGHLEGLDERTLGTIYEMVAKLRRPAVEE